jgi:RHS repeat-associated protein
VDRLVGLDYFGARYFSGAQGRFTSPDLPLIDQNPGNPQSWNLYAYARNNPLRNRDLDGRVCIFGIGNTCDDKVPPPPPPPPPPAPKNVQNPVYPTIDQAGAAAAKADQQGQQRTGSEHASSVYALGPAFTYTDPVTQNKPDTVDPNNTTGYYNPRTAPLDAAPIPAGTALVGEAHSHPNVVKAADGRPAAPGDQLSSYDMQRSQDMTTVHRSFHASYVGLPDGRVIKYEPRAPSRKRVKVVK